MLLIEKSNICFNQIFIKVFSLIKLLVDFFFSKLFFLIKYFIRNEYIWQDGFIFDFLQKKTIDLWIRQFIIFTGFLFSERFIFENIVRLYIAYFLLPNNYYSNFEINNISEMLNNIIYLFFLITHFYIIFIVLIY